ncbi:MAG: hypothetical protein DRJ64_04445 [Thermoprotei archaeon]|nr:MAG: hypothetical protein DRJ64_04445 [Thermoprotei archaeon]
MSKREEEMRIQLKNEMVVLRNIAYAIDPSGSPTRAARYLIGLSGKNIGVAIEKRRNIAIISVRARKDNIDLNIILRRLAPKHGGSGGGHPHAGGARIPLENLEKFIKELDEEVGSYLTHQRYPLHIAP